MLGEKTKLGTRLDGVALISKRISERVSAMSMNPDRGVNRWTYAGLFALALATCAAAAFFLPNSEQDAYSYAEIIGRFSERLASGHFRLADLFGFWLPLFQFVAAIVNLVLHDPIVAGKAINVLCAAVTCVLVFAITRKLTRSLLFSGLAFALILIDPLRILYSAACMTDLPHICLVLVSLWFALGRRWVMAAAFAALAESVRIEAWSLIVTLPLLQYVYERRISPAVLALVLIPPLAWLGIGYVATGSPFAYFADRARYHAAYLEFHPTRRGFVFDDVSADLTHFLLGAGKAVFIGSFAMSAIVLIRKIRARGSLEQGILVPIVYGIGMLGLLSLAYVTKAQPVVLPRYGLGFLALGLPLFFWLTQWLVQQTNRALLRTVIVAAAIVASLSNMNGQLPIISKVLDDFHAHQLVTAALLSELERSDPDSRCFSDDAAVRVLSGEPRERFVISNRVPSEARKTPAAFEAYLRDQQIRHLVFIRTEDSLPVKFYPELGRSKRMADNRFELITFARSSFGPDVWLFRLRNAQADSRTAASRPPN
jgi:hypothetical protein